MDPSARGTAARLSISIVAIAVPAVIAVWRWQSSHQLKLLSITTSDTASLPAKAVQGFCSTPELLNTGSPLVSWNEARTSSPKLMLLTFAASSAAPSSDSIYHSGTVASM